MSFEYLDEASTAAWLSASRADRRARAEALRRAGEMALHDLFKKYHLSAATCKKIAALPIDEIVQRAREACIKLVDHDRPISRFCADLAALPYGYRTTDLTAIGAISLHAEKIVDFQESPLLACRVGRRAETARRIAAWSEDGLRYGVATSPSLVPIFGDLAGAFDRHLSDIRRAAVVARKAGFVLKIRSTEIVISEIGANIHSNMIWENKNRNAKFPIDDFESAIGARYYDIDVYDIGGLAKYITKPPISTSSGCAGDLLYDPEVAIWMHKPLSGRRLIDFGRDHRSHHDDMEQKASPSPGTGSSIDHRQHDDDLEQNVPDEDTGSLIDRGRKSEKNSQEGTGDLICQTENNKSYNNKIKTENLIIKIRPASYFESGIIEPIIIVRNYTNFPKTESGISGLKKIVEIHNQASHVSCYQPVLNKNEKIDIDIGTSYTDHQHAVISEKIEDDDDYDGDFDIDPGAALAARIYEKVQDENFYAAYAD